MTSTADTTTTNPSTTASALVTRVRNQWAIVQAQWVAMPDTLRQAWEQVGERIRAALDLPTKHELAQLSARLDELDRRLAGLADSRPTTASAPVVEAKASPAEEVPSRSRITADKRARKR